MEQDFTKETNTIRIAVYYCRNLELFSAYEQKTFSRSHPGVSMVSIPCSGKIEVPYLLKTLAAGFDGVLVLACAKAACQYFEGSLRSQRRVAYARSWLVKIQMEPQRIEFVHQPPKDVEALEKTLRDFRARLESLRLLSPIAVVPAG